MTRGEKVATVLLWSLAAAAAVRLGRIAAQASARPTSGFGSYHAAARLLVSGRLDGSSYRDEVFQAEVGRLAPGLRDIPRPNPPCVGLLLAPVATAPHLVARVLFIVAGLAALALAVLLLTKVTRLEGPVAAAFAAFALVIPPEVENVRNGQAYDFLALGVVALAAARRDATKREGMCVGLAAGLKLAFPFVWLAAYWRRWRKSGWAIATVGALGAATLAFTGPARFVEWLRLTVRVGTRPEIAVAAYQSQAGVLARLFRGDARWNPSRSCRRRRSARS